MSIEPIGEITGEFRDIGGYAPVVSWDQDAHLLPPGTKLYTAPPTPSPLAGEGGEATMTREQYEILREAITIAAKHGDMDRWRKELAMFDSRWISALRTSPPTLAPSQGTAVTDGDKRGTFSFNAALHPDTANLVATFAGALAAKLYAAQLKYGYSDGWASNDWMDACRAKLVEHVAKGDPRDVAAYCAFLWHHGESTRAAKKGEQWWGSYECFACTTVFDVRTDFESSASAVCPTCSTACELRGRWLADEAGFGSRASIVSQATLASPAVRDERHPDPTCKICGGSGRFDAGGHMTDVGYEPALEECECWIDMLPDSTHQKVAAAGDEAAKEIERLRAELDRVSMLETVNRAECRRQQSLLIQSRDALRKVLGHESCLPLEVASSLWKFVEDVYVVYDSSVKAPPLIKQPIDWSLVATPASIRPPTLLGDALVATTKASIRSVREKLYAIRTDFDSARKGFGEDYQDFATEHVREINAAMEDLFDIVMRLPAPESILAAEEENNKCTK